MSKIGKLVLILLAIFAIGSRGWAAPSFPATAGLEDASRASSGFSSVQPDLRGSQGPLDFTDIYVPADYGTIQAAINAAAPGDIIHVAAGTYVENLVVNKSLTIDGAGELLTTVYPAVSDPGPCGGGSFQNSQVIVVSAHDVTISNLTVDGDNPGLTSGVVSYGADLDARNGIIDSNGPWNNLIVHHTTVKNVYLRGIYARSGGSGFHFHDNTVTNVAACYASIGIFNFGGAGVIEDNTVSYCGDAIAANWSRGTQFLNNTITNSSSGVHTDNNGGSGGVADLIQGNIVDDGAANSYGVWAFFPYFNVVLNNNTVNNCDVGLFSWGSAGSGQSQFTNNIVDGENRANCTGIYVTPGLDSWLNYQSNGNATFSGNSTANCFTGFAVETDEDGTYSTTISTSGYTYTGHTYDVYLSGMGTLNVGALTGNTVWVQAPSRIQKGIDVALSGGTVTASNGTYNEAPNIYKSLTLAGQTQAGVIINASSFSDYGIDATGDYNFGFHDFTLDGPDANISSAYGLKVSGNNATAIISNLTVYGCYKTGIDLNGLTSGSITNCTSTGAAWGNGYAVTDCDNIAFSNITSSGNAWGGVAVYTKGTAFTGGSDGVSFTGTLNLAEARPIYTEKNGPAYPAITNLNVSLAAFPYVVGSTSDAYTEVYSASQANAVATAILVGATGWTYDRGSDYFYVTPALKIQAAVTAAGSLTPVEATGDEVHLASGTFTESVNVNKYVKIIGEGSVLASLTTVTSSTGPVFTIAASGLNIANPLLFQDLQVLPIGQPGFDVASGSWSYVKWDNVHVIGTNPTDDTENECGIRIWNTTGYPSLSNLTVQNCAFDNLHYGWYFMKQVGAFSDNVSNVAVTGTSFTHNAAKGIYAEKLSDASFANCEVNNNGWNTAFYNATWNAGFDFNLKGQQAYQNISLSYCDFEGNAISTANGAALMIKARGSGGDPSYDANPASLTNVQLTNCKIVGNQRGVRFGEPGKANTSPANSIVTDCAVYGNTNGDFINATTAAQDAGGNWWGTATPNWGTQVVGSNVNHTPWYGVNGTYPNPGFIPLSGGIAGEMSDAYIGCGGSCNTTTLYLKLGVAGLPNLQVVFQLPAGFTAGPLGTVTPLSNDDPNLIQAFASDLGSGQIQVDMGFNSPYSTGDLTKYVAAIPLTNTGAGTGVYNVTGISSLWIDGLGGNHVNDYTMTPVTINVDCTVPVINSFTTSATCAFGNATQTIDAFSVNLTDGLSNLDEAWITFAPGGGTFSLFGVNQTSPYTATFPSVGDAAAFYALLANNACNTLTLHLTDAECNVAATVDLANVGRDEVAPSLSVSTSIPLNYCFNNNSLTANYGGAYLDDYVDITSLLGANPCMAASGTLTISHAGLADFVVALDKTNYPSDNTEALALWTWMLGLPAIANSNGGSFTFDVKAADCAGNLTSTQQFTICVDTQAPTNTVTAFDARPAHLGVWLKWSWNASPDAQEMRVYRSPLSGEYPGYASDLWNSNANYDVTQIDPAGWTLVATQSALTGTVTSGVYGANNNRGDFHTHVSGGTYWLDAETGWVDGDGNAAAYRDIYRYVTFVKDAGGNWSVGAPVSMTVNADRSTNYWLGDFSTADGAGLPGSRGRVDSDDLGLLSPVYFTNTGGYRNIGPVVVENGNIGKGIPDPDGLGAINFSDLVPFSFNYGMVGPVTNPLEFVIEPGVADVRPFNRLDEMPSVSINMDSEIQLTEGTEFTVTVSMSGNEGNTVKAAEAILSFNPSLLDFVSATMGNVAAPEGTMFSKASLIEGVDGQVGFVAASCGGWSTLSGSAVLGTVTFRIKSDIHAACNITLSSVKLLDNSGEVVEPEGNAISVLNAAALPDNYALYQNYPNPFNPTTNIQFDLKESGHVSIQVFNTLGQIVATVVDRDMVAGRHDVTFDASSMASGLYMYRISVNGFSDLKKMVLIR